MRLWLLLPCLGLLGSAATVARASDGPASPASARLERRAVDGTPWTPTTATVDRATRTETVYTAQASGGGGSGGGSGDLAKQLQNPVADLISLPIQANLDQGFGPEDDAWRWTINVQPVVPVQLNSRWNVISRTIVPVVVREGIRPGEGDAFGLGDTVQSFFLSPRSTEPFIWGVGPVFLLPTATESRLGAGQWGAGPTGVILKQSGPWTYGLLANHVWSFADAGTRSDVLVDPEVNATFLQPFLSYTLPSALTFTINSESTYDWEAKAWNVPINVLATQVTKICNQPVSLGLGFRYWAETATGGPEWGIRLTWTFLFPK